MSKSNEQVAREFLQLAATGSVREAYERHVAPGFRHHNPWFRGDAEALMQGMQENADKNPGKALEVKMALQEGDRVMLMSHVRHDASERGFALVHVFRFEDGRIAELWDIAQAIPDSSVNENGMF